MGDFNNVMMRKVTLLPCPFCGGPPYEYIEGGAIIIKCLNNGARSGCSAQILRHLVPSGAWTEAVDKCRDAWNTRVKL